MSRTEPAARTLRLPRDGSVVDRMRVVTVTDNEVVLEFVADGGPGGSPPDDGDAKSTTLAPPVVDPPPKTSSSEPALSAPYVEPPPPGATDVVRFVARADDIAAAVAQVAVVEPPGATDQAIAGYLFTVDNDESGVPSGYISASDAEQNAVASFPVRSVESHGSFALPVARCGAFEYLPGEELAFCAARSWASRDRCHARPSATRCPSTSSMSRRPMAPALNSLMTSRRGRWATGGACWMGYQG